MGYVLAEVLGGEGRAADELLPRSALRIGEVAAQLGVRTSALRTWESVGLLAPKREPGTKYRVFDPADLRDAQMIKMLRQGHYPLLQIHPILDGLRRTGSTSALREAIARRQTALTRRGTAMLEGASHLHSYITAGGRIAPEPVS